MNLTCIDWIIVVVLLISLYWAGWICNRFSRGVADFLVAGRSVDRYLGVGSCAMTGLAAVTMLALWQMCYQSGIAGVWWYLMKFPFAIILALTGWGIYRFRQTRAMTIPQFLEMRYSKRFRIFSAILIYFAGVLNMGIFPIVGAGFFVYFCGLPDHIDILGIHIPTILIIMILLQGTAVVLCFSGGQVTLIVTDFIQNVFVSMMFIVIVFVIYRMFTWDQVVQAYTSAPGGDAMLHPFKANTSQFNIWFFLIDAFWLFYNIVSWSPSILQASTASNAHEAKMMKLMTTIRQLALLGLGLFLLPYAAFVLMHHPDFASQAAKVNSIISNITNDQVKSQMIVPVAISQILPPGLMGAFVAVVMFAFISCHDTYLLSWGGILIQDIIIPLRGRPLDTKAHLWLLRFSILGVAVFTVIWSMFFKQVDNIFMYFDITAGIYLSGAGIVLLGGIYWKKGTTLAAWVSMITGSILSAAGFIYRSYNPDFLNGRLLAFMSACIAILVYIIISLSIPNTGFDLNKLLHIEPGQKKKSKWWKLGSEISRADKILYVIIVAAVLLYFTVFIIVGVYNLTHKVSTEKWVQWWHVYFYIMFFGGSVFLIWITIGGIRDLYRMFSRLRAASRDITDDGSVQTPQNVEKVASGTRTIVSKTLLILLFIMLIFLTVSCRSNARSTMSTSNYIIKHRVESVLINADWQKASWKSIEPFQLNHYLGEKPKYLPNVMVKMQYDANNIYIIWKVDDQFVKVVENKLNGRVFDDSCVEFFFTPGPDIKIGYFNFEVNAKGIPLMRYQSARDVNIVYFDIRDLESIEIAHSLQNSEPTEINEPITWIIESRIPFDILRKYCTFENPSTKAQWRVNFYKCANKSSNPHWLTWSRIDVPKPNFHVPEYFGVIEFD